MKNILFISLISSFLFLACSKKDQENVAEFQEIKPNYDTVAIDSFSAGATSVDIARQIRVSSQQYQDSLKEVLKTHAEEKRIKEELEKENKKKQEEEKKKTEQEKKQKAIESSSSGETKTD